MNFDLFSIVFLLGALQGLILALYLFFSRSDKRQAKYFLGFLILVLSYDMFETALWIKQISLPTTEIFTYSLLFTLGPSLYLTIKTSIHQARISRRTILLLYLPAVVDFAVSSFIFALRFKQFFKHNLSSDTFLAIYNIHLISSRLLMVIAFWIYFGFAAREFQKFNRSNGDNISHSPESEIGIIKKWLKSFLYVCLVISIVWTVTIFGVVFFDRQQVLYFYYPLELLLAFLIYWIGFTGYHRIKIVYLNEQKNSRIYFSQLPPDEIADAAAALSKAMTADKIYLDPELTLGKLASHLALPPKTISSVLNQHLKIGFNEYVNSFRVEEVKKRLSNPDNKHLTILAVAFDSGFNSLATFQRVFKNVTGITPKQFLTNNLQKS